LRDTAAKISKIGASRALPHGSRHDLFSELIPQVWFDGGLMKEDDKVMTVVEVSEYLHVHPSTIYRLLRKKEIPAFRVGSDWRFNRESIDSWRNEREKR
jgi:excisionase family DNA binding protein